MSIGTPATNVHYYTHRPHSQKWLSYGSHLPVFFAPSREGTQLLPSTAAATSCQFSTQKHEGADSVPWPLLTHLGNGQVIYTGLLHPPWILPPSLHIYQPTTQNPKQNTHLLLPHVQKYHASEMGRVRSTSWFPAGVDLILKSFVPK